MRLAIIFLIITLYSSQRFEDCVVYVNGDNELLILDDNRISYRLKNKGGLITYSYFSGDYKKRKNKYKLGADLCAYAEIQSSPDSRSQQDGILICFYNRDEEPLQYTPIVLGFTENIIQREYYSDDSGCINLIVNPSIDGFESRFSVQLLGNTFSQDIKIKKGEEYSITLQVPPKYGIQNAEDYKREILKIESMNQNRVRVYDGITKEWKVFEKLNRMEKCHDVIFEG